MPTRCTPNPRAVLARRSAPLPRAGMLCKRKRPHDRSALAEMLQHIHARSQALEAASRQGTVANGEIERLRTMVEEYEAAMTTFNQWAHP